MINKVKNYINFLIFKRYFKKVTGKTLNPEQKKMFFLVHEHFFGIREYRAAREDGASIFLVVYGAFSEKFRGKNFLVGSNYMSKLIKKHFGSTEDFPIAFSTSAETIRDYNCFYSKKFDLLLVDDNDRLSSDSSQELIRQASNKTFIVKTK